MFWIKLNNDSSYTGFSNDGRTLDFHGTDSGIVYFPIKDLADRKYNGKCTSSHCPGLKKEILHGCDLSFVPEGLNFIEEAITAWESGYQKVCPATFLEEPTDHSFYRANANYGTTLNPITKYECTGNLSYENITFVNDPPLLVFTVLQELSNKVENLAIVPKLIVIHNETFHLGGCTANIGGHFIA